VKEENRGALYVDKGIKVACRLMRKTCATGLFITPVVEWLPARRRTPFTRGMHEDNRRGGINARTLRQVRRHRSGERAERHDGERPACGRGQNSLPDLTITR